MTSWLGRLIQCTRYRTSIQSLHTEPPTRYIGGFPVFCLLESRKSASVMPFCWYREVVQCPPSFGSLDRETVEERGRDGLVVV